MNRRVAETQRRDDNKYLSIEKCGKGTRRKIILWTVGMIIAGSLLTLYSPFEYLFHYFGYENSNGCPLLTFTGVPCPLCGMGRGFWAVISMDSGKMFYYNPLAVFFYAVSGAGLGSVLVMALSGYKIKLKEGAWRFWYVFAGVVVVMWALNIMFGHHGS